MRRLGVDHHELIFVREQPADFVVLGEQVMQLVAPAAPVASKHQGHALVRSLGSLGRCCKLDLRIGVLVIDRGFLGAGLGCRFLTLGGLSQADDGGENEEDQAHGRAR